MNIVLKVIALLFVLGLFVLLFRILSWRIPIGETIPIKSKVRFQMIDAGQGDLLRTGIEKRFGNKRLFLDEPYKGQHFLFVSVEDWDEIWSELSTMRKEGYTYRLTFETRKLILGGYAVAKVVHKERLEEEPRMSK